MPSFIPGRAARQTRAPWRPSRRPRLRPPRRKGHARWLDLRPGRMPLQPPTWECGAQLHASGAGCGFSPRLPSSSPSWWQVRCLRSCRRPAARRRNGISLRCALRRSHAYAAGADGSSALFAPRRREQLASLAAARLENAASSRRGHPQQEPVGPTDIALLRLEGPLHVYSTPPVRVRRLLSAFDTRLSASSIQNRSRASFGRAVHGRAGLRL